MTPWEWWAGYPNDPIYDIATGPTREAVIREALRNLNPGEEFRIVEARSSTAARYWEDAFVLFARVRDEETLVAGPHLLEEPKP